MPAIPAAPAARCRSLNPLAHDVVAPALMANLRYYKYSGVDRSLLARLVMQRYWSWAVTLVPMGVAPNALTLAGFVVSMSSVLLVAAYCFAPLWDAGAAGGWAAVPGWAWVYCAAALFAYQTLDAIDGKQARRTGASSALGELFDHGCDALFLPFVTALTAGAAGLRPAQAVAHMLLVCSGLGWGIMEQYATGTLDLGYVNGPVEGILVTCGIFLTSGALGRGWWLAPLPAAVHVAIPLPPAARPLLGLEALTLTAPCDWAFTLTAATAVPTMVINVWNACTGPRAHAKVQLPLAAASSVAATAATLALHRTGAAAAVAAEAPLALEVLFGVLTSFTVTRLTVARLCRAPYNALSVPFVIFWLCTAAVAAAGRQPELAAVVGRLLWGAVAAVVLCYLHMAGAVFRQFAQHLGVNILTLTEGQLAAVRAKAE